MLLIFVATWLPLLALGKECNPSDHNQITPECDALGGSPLIVRNGDDYANLSERLSSVREIRAGVVVEGTDLEEFDMLKNVDIIYNPNGPALVFRRNSKLKRINTGSLKNLTAPQHKVEFDNDNFPLEAYENAESLDDLLHMEAYSRNVKDECSASFMEIKNSPEEDNLTWVLILLIVVAITFFVFDLLVAWMLFKAYKDDKKLDKQVEEASKPKQPKKIEEKPDDITKEPEEPEEGEELQ